MATQYQEDPEEKKNNDVDSDESDRDDDSDRMERFVETSDNPEVFKSKNLNELKPFYNGVVLDDRMSEIRKSIYYIRHNWEEFSQFLEALRLLLLDDGGIEFRDQRTRDHFDTLFSTKRDWLTAEKANEAELHYDAIKLYTSKEGHARIYRLSNDIFRKEGLVAVETIRSVVFLVELINVDLYNYCQKCPEQMGFEGMVYRGICLSENDLGAFKSLREEPIGRRNIAVPLGLFSASASLNVAKKFIGHQLKHHRSDDASLRPLIIKIHVISLDAAFVEHYTRRFPSTVLTTICAVDIHKLSRHRKEREVLLRGPFMLVLDYYQDDDITIMGQACNILEVVMLNANRDHISTSFLGGQDDLARDMFGSMVAVTRSKFAMEYCRGKGLADDEREYTRIYEESQLKLKVLMKQ